jgi:NADH:ubiquinone oxidoreductase subunit 3 (subunit A)
MSTQFLPVLITLIVAVGFAVVLLSLAALAGQRERHKSENKGETYESGLPLIDTSLKRISVKFYIVALIFVVLDVEVAFLFPWAVTYRKMIGSGSLVVLYDMLAFMALLAVAYVYLWKKGILDWGRRQPRLGGGDE